MIESTLMVFSQSLLFLLFLSIWLRKSLFWSNSKSRKAVNIVIATTTQQEQLVKAKWRLEPK